MRQADETLADNMKEFGFELLGWYDVQRVFGEYDPLTGERLSIGDRLLAGGMLLLSIVPPAKGAGVAGKAAIKGAKAIDAASALAKVKHVVRHDKMKAVGDIAFCQTVRSPLAETARLFKKQWDELVESVASVSWQPAYAGVGPAPRVWMGEARNEVKDAALHMVKKAEGEVVGKGAGEAVIKGTGNSSLIPGTPGQVVGGDSTKLGKNMLEEMGVKRLTKWSGYQAQHIIPAEMASHPVLKKIGMNLDLMFRNLCIIYKK